MVSIIRLRYAGLLMLLMGSAGAAEPGDVRQAELLHLLKHDCGSCHGLRLEGGLGPALRPEQLAERPLELLVATILDGRFGTAMPPWRPFLSEDEARWLAVGLKSGNLP